jgi:hypothetical protein
LAGRGTLSCDPTSRVKAERSEPGESRKPASESKSETMMYIYIYIWGEIRTSSV